VAAGPVNSKVHHSVPIMSAAAAAQYSGSIIPYIWDWLRELVNGSSKEKVIEPVLSGLRKWLIQDL